MKPIESAEELAVKVWAAVEHTEDGTIRAGARLIEADRNAARVALLDELEAQLAEHCGTAGGWRFYIDDARLKYGKP